MALASNRGQANFFLQSTTPTCFCRMRGFVSCEETLEESNAVTLVFIYVTSDEKYKCGAVFEKSGIGGKKIKGKHVAILNEIKRPGRPRAKGRDCRWRFFCISFTPSLLRHLH